MTRVDDCLAEEIGLKSAFLGPRCENGPWLVERVEGIFKRWFQWRQSLFPEDGNAISKEDQVVQDFSLRRERFHKILDQLAISFEKEVPKFSPRYVGHMLSEISMPAMMGHIVALLHNPNNISGESSLVGVQIEDEAIEALAEMVAYSPCDGSRGHFTSGGTIANMEALLRARGRLALWIAFGAASAMRLGKKQSLMKIAHMGWEEFTKLKDQENEFQSTESIIEKFSFIHANPFRIASQLEKSFTSPFQGPVILVPQNRHYSWQKGMHFLGLGKDALWSVALDENGRLSVPDLKEKLQRAEQECRPVMMVVSVAGTTELGSFDPVHEVDQTLVEWREKRNMHVWHHVDAAYGGFFCSLIKGFDMRNSHSLAAPLKAISRSDSVTLDPHKLGYVPYASGVILVREHQNYILESMTAPYIQYRGRDRGPYTIEGSRAATGAAATWMIANTVGLDQNGYGLILGRTLRIKDQLSRRLREAKLPIRLAPGCDSNIICFAVAKEGELLSVSNARTQKLYERFSPEKRSNFTVSKTTLVRRQYANYIEHYLADWRGVQDTDGIVLIRMCILNPYFDSKEMDIQLSGELVTSFELAFEEIDASH